MAVISQYTFCKGMHFDYDGDPDSILVNIKNVLIAEGFKIAEYAPEDGFMFTDYRQFNWGSGRRLIAITVHVHDRVIITGMGSGMQAIHLKMVLVNREAYSDKYSDKDKYSNAKLAEMLKTNNGVIEALKRSLEVFKNSDAEGIEKSITDFIINSPNL